MMATGFPLLYALATGMAGATCVLLYRAHRAAPWLAGATASSCLFFVCVSVGATYQARDAIGLLPLWCAVAILAALHLGAARREGERARTTQRASQLTDDEPPGSSPAASSLLV